MKLVEDLQFLEVLVAESVPAGLLERLEANALETGWVQVETAFSGTLLETQLLIRTQIWKPTFCAASGNPQNMVKNNH